jgi:hypothetical protein
MRITIDRDTVPSCPDGMTVAEHHGEQMEFDSEKMKLYFSARQTGEQPICGHDLRTDLEGKRVLNACVLDYLLTTHGYECIPHYWGDRLENGYDNLVVFWGTIYRTPSGNLFVRYLDGEHSGHMYVGEWFGTSTAAAILID